MKEEPAFAGFAPPAFAGFAPPAFAGFAPQAILWYSSSFALEPTSSGDRACPLLGPVPATKS